MRRGRMTSGDEVGHPDRWSLRHLALGLVLSCSSFGCITIRHGDAPLVSPTASRKDQCVHRSTLSLVPGSATMERGNSTGAFSFGGGQPWYTTFNPTSVRTDVVGSVSGATPRLGDRQLSSRAFFDTLGDEELSEAFTKDQARFGSGRLVMPARIGWIVSLSAALALVTTGGIMASSIKPDPMTGKSDVTLPVTLLVVSIGALLFGGGLYLLDSFNQDAQLQLVARDELVVPTNELRPVLEQRVTAFNELAAKACGE